MDSLGKKLTKSSITCRLLPAELMNELFASMPFGNAFGLLAKMPNGLLAKNVQKMINGIKEAIKVNKLNAENCSPNLNISEEGFEAKNSDIGNIYVRAVLPIPAISLNLNAINKPIVAFYYEVQILNGFFWYDGIYIGFCDKKFSLEEIDLGDDANSIGICNKWSIWIDGTINGYENGYEYFEKEDFIGIGIIHKQNSSIECFTTSNGKLLGKTKLSKKFANIELFPAIKLKEANDSIRLNFGKEEWKFKEFEKVIA